MVEYSTEKAYPSKNYMKTKRIHLPKAIYELLPLLYLSLGASCILSSHSIGLSVVGAYLIAQGLFKSVLRINYRSPDQALTQSPTHRRAR